ncbi:hypothetical protein NQ315_004051 [Exocentrus adspersus]|uniref:Uncharacterized protein n=1 Tax=Exocentrus adspersus TaxID=1586481 RepID=A0AAV8W7L9_9CUCU|nr:hypothetical protein NQ315_004051 [Exocentrus adspersus]
MCALLLNALTFTLRKKHDPKTAAVCEREKENGVSNHEHDFMENGRDVLTGSPDSANSRNDKELEDLMDVDAAPKTCIMHALSIVSTPTPQPGSSPPPLAAVAPHTDNGDEWKPQGHTRLSPQAAAGTLLVNSFC